MAKGERMSVDYATAVSFIKSVDLSEAPYYGAAVTAQDASAHEIFDKAKAQAQVVGSNVLSFVTGLDTTVREAISNSSLLAQLVADRRTSAESQPMEWFSAYSEVLKNLGWVLQENHWADHTTQGAAAEVHEKILEVAAVVLGPAPAALAILTASVKALRDMKPESSWLTIFNREAKKGRISRFQIGIAEEGENGNAFVTQLCCLVEAESKLTQVLFFKFRKEKARFRANLQKSSFNKAALTEIAPAIRKKISAFQEGYLGTIEDLIP